MVMVMVTFHDEQCRALDILIFHLDTIQYLHLYRSSNTDSIKSSERRPKRPRNPLLQRLLLVNLNTWWCACQGLALRVDDELRANQSASHHHTRSQACEQQPFGSKLLG